MVGVIEAETRSVRARDGRELRVRVPGGDYERCVLAMHGLPGSGLLFGRWLGDVVPGMGGGCLFGAPAEASGGVVLQSMGCRDPACCLARGLRMLRREGSG